MTDFSELVDVSSIPHLNVGLTSASEDTMKALLGAPRMPLTTDCQNDRASPVIASMIALERITKNFRVTGLKPAVESLQTIFTQLKVDEPELIEVLSTGGMLCVRLRKPTSGVPSTRVSNHAWGTGIDFKLIGQDAPGATGSKVPRFIAVLAPHFNRAGWYSGIGFNDAMHFEVAEETIRKWQTMGTLAAKVA